ncbi:putative centrosomal protein [Apostichopus japonicus]|uniref:Centrosomal protein of 19 kDa n=1 Tax=Stichopus japonicus TaxID=307972 RepID=A0A2G8K8F7_STIJA|nr:putative centrosomal protein [Apostichopus japonicus]
MSIEPSKCGIKIEPPALVLTYLDGKTGKKRQRTMPLRNFTSRVGVTRVAEELKSNPRHRKYLESVPTLQMEKLFRIIQERLRGLSLNDSLDKVKEELKVDPDEDLNKLNDAELKTKKHIMDESFEKNRKKQEDPDFVYDVEVDFENVGGPAIESSGWDSGSDSDLDF